MEVLDAYQIRATVALNSSVCTYYPRVIEECKKRSWELMGHGISNSWSMTELSADDEEAVVKESVETIKKASGESPRGWLGPALAETPRTLNILSRNGIRYVCDWCNDDQPYPMRTDNGPLISLPYSIEMNDITIFVQQGLTPTEFYRECKDQFDQLYTEGSRSGRVMGVALHPFIIGQPFRIDSLKRLLRYITAKKGVWFATGSEITDWYVRNYLKTESLHV